VFVAGGELTAEVVTDLRFGEWLRVLASHTDDVFAIGNGERVLSAIGLSRRITPADNSIDCVSRSAVQHALEMIRQDFGVSVLRRVLEMLPDTGLANFNAIASDSVKSIRERIHESAQWITLNCNKPISITVAAQTAGMSDRSYLRHFRAEMGMKPSDHLRRSRVKRAAALLESSDLPVDKIARRCGLTSGECLARLFRTILHISPTAYRDRFRPSSAAIR
jgi:transcriptional regulator GlxA family with amidase domain